MGRTDPLKRIDRGLTLLVLLALIGLFLTVGGGSRPAQALEDPSLLSVAVVTGQVVAATNTWVEAEATVGSLADVTFEITPSKGGAVVWREEATVGDLATGDGGVQVFSWRGRTEQGTPVADGAYTLTVTSSPAVVDVCGLPDCTQLRTVPLTVKNAVTAPDTVKPGAPTGFAVIGDADASWMRWDANPEPDVVSYAVWLSTTGSKPWTYVGSTAHTSYTDAVPRSGTVWYSVSAVDTSGNKSRRSDAASNDFTTMSATIGPAGGTIQSSTGSVKLVFPPGAVASPTEFTIAQVVTPPAAPTNQVRSGRMFDITPHGYSFAVPVQLTIRLKIPKGATLAKNYPVDTTVMGYFNTTSGQWEKVNNNAATIDPDAGTITVPLTHLSSYGPLSAGDPHGSYTTTTNYCGWCHSAHAAPGPNLHPYPTEKETCYQCHNAGQGGRTPGATSDILGAFGETTIGASTKTSYHPVPAAMDGYTLACSDCHTAHRLKTDYTQGLRTWDGVSWAWSTSLDKYVKVYTYSTKAAPLGNNLCYNCHGARSILPVGDGTTPALPYPLGDHRTFTNSIHDSSKNVPFPNATFSGATNTVTVAAWAANVATLTIGTNTIAVGNPVKVSGVNVAAYNGSFTVTAKPSATQISYALPLGANPGNGNTGSVASGGSGIKCAACHSAHGSNQTRLTTAKQEALCYQCHSVATNSSGGPPTTNATNPNTAFTAAANDYTVETPLTNGIRIYHHPVSDTDQPAGARQVECYSCHNNHVVDQADNGTTTGKIVDPINVTSKLTPSWTAANAGYRGRGIFVTASGTWANTNGGTATITMDGNSGYNNSLNVGDSIIVAGATPVAYNGTYRVESRPTTTSITYRLPLAATPGALSGSPDAFIMASDKTIEAFCFRCHQSKTVTNPIPATTAAGARQVIGAAYTNPNATLTIGAHDVATGDTVVVSGVTSSGPGTYNGTYAVTAIPTPSQVRFSVGATNPGTWTAGTGSVSVLKRVLTASWASNVATITLNGHSIGVNDEITVAGVVPAGYNGTYKATAVTDTTVSYALVANPGAYTSGGTVKEKSYVPYSIKMVNDTTIRQDGSGVARDTFDFGFYAIDGGGGGHGPLGSRVTCIACHDMHGSSNSSMLRSSVVTVCAPGNTGTWDARTCGGVVAGPADYGATQSASDTTKVNTFCDTCHSPANHHNDGNNCLRCHYHGSSRKFG